MKRVALSVENGLLAEGIMRSLKDSGEFETCRLTSQQNETLSVECEAFEPDILLMEVSFAPICTFENRMSEVAELRRRPKSPKIAFLCDETSAPTLARKVMLAMQNRQIDAFYFSSVTSSYLTAALTAL